VLIWSALAVALLATPPTDVVRTGERAAYEGLLKDKVGQAYANFTGAPCPMLSYQRVYAAPVKVGGNPNTLALREKIKAQGCGRLLTLNFNTIRNDNSPTWFIGVRLPGESDAELSLQESAWPAVLKQARAELKLGCEGQRVDDVYLVARSGHVHILERGQVLKRISPGSITLILTPELETQRDRLNFGSAWAETWPIELCGQDRTTTVVFIPMKGRDASIFLLLPTWRRGREGRIDRAPAE